MKSAFVIATIVFWAAVAVVVWFGWRHAETVSVEESELPTAPSQETSETGVYSLEEVARHGHADDCWMIIHGQVYDLSGYVHRHPSDPAVFLKYCGREASVGFDTKDHGRPHSTFAKALLKDFLLGPLAGE